MKLKADKVFTLMMLSTLISAVSVCPAMASSAIDLKAHPFLISQASQAGELAGVINSISGESVEFAQFNGPTRNITIRRSVIRRLGLRAGTKIAVVLNDNNVAVSVRVIRPKRALW